MVGSLERAAGRRWKAIRPGTLEYPLRVQRQRTGGATGGDQTATRLRPPLRPPLRPTFATRRAAVHREAVRRAAVRRYFFRSRLRSWANRCHRRRQGACAAEFSHGRLDRHRQAFAGRRATCSRAASCDRDLRCRGADGLWRPTSDGPCPDADRPSPAAGDLGASLLPAAARAAAGSEIRRAEC